LYLELAAVVVLVSLEVLGAMAAAETVEQEQLRLRELSILAAAVAEEPQLVAQEL
jgi:hypothetical protein